MKKQPSILKYKHLGISTQNANVVFLKDDSYISISEGFEALTRIRVSTKKNSIVASLHVVTSNILLKDEIGLSNTAAEKLDISEGDFLTVSHLETINSLEHLRAKIYNHKFDYAAYQNIITDIVKRDYSNIHLSAFITACAGDRMDITEIANLTKAMITSGIQLKWNKEIVMDKHCIGIHAVFSGNAYQELLDCGVDEIVTCNTIPHPSNAIDLSDALAKEIQGLMPRLQ